MKKWEEIEDKVNLTLIKKYENLIKLSLGKILVFKKYAAQKAINLYNKILPAQELLTKKIKNLSLIEPKSIISSMKKILKEVTWENAIKIIKAPPYENLVQYIKKNAVNLSFLLIFSIGFFQVYKEVITLLPSNDAKREIASIEVSENRPSYYLLKKKHLKIENITIPVALNQNKRISSIIADVIIECPNRTTQQFLYNSPHLIQDKLNNTIAPQIHSFPLTEEGKVILRKKISIEISNLLKESQFQHHEVKKVNIIQVTSS